MVKRTRGSGRFVTLKSGRVIFIPAGKRSKWADMRDKIKASGVGSPAPKRHRDWEKAGLEPGDFGVESWGDIDPEVVEDVIRRAG